jgi:hypothetical protein
MVSKHVYSEQLTGNWYLKRTLYGWKVMVEVQQLIMCRIDMSIDPPCNFYRKATITDLQKLKINFK